MWIPFGVASILLLLRQPEPRRGHQEEAVQEELAKDALGAIEFIGTGALLPEPIRVGTLDYTRCSSRQVWNELVRIPTMWLGVISLTISQLLLAGLGVWAIPYFKRVFHMSAAEAGGVAGTLLIGSVAGVLGGGIVADRYLARGVLCARVYVVAFASIVGTFALLPAFLSTNLLLTVPFFLLAGVFLTVPLAPAEALVSDVVVAELRGRAFTVRSVVRALSALGPVFIGVVSSALGGGGHGLRMALIVMTPLYAIGGVIMLRAVRTYPHDLAFVLAEARRRQAGSM
jgi:MFS family permease